MSRVEKLEEDVCAVLSMMGVLMEKQKEQDEQLKMTLQLLQVVIENKKGKE